VVLDTAILDRLCDATPDRTSCTHRLLAEPNWSAYHGPTRPGYLTDAVRSHLDDLRGAPTIVIW
jgi:hypothetical protein